MQSTFPDDPNGTMVLKIDTIIGYQQDIAQQLQLLSSRQHEIVRLWAELGEVRLHQEARNVEEVIIRLIGYVLHLEAAALEQVEHLVSEEESAFRTQQPTQKL